MRADRLGLQWIGYAPRGFRPRRVLNATTNATSFAWEPGAYALAQLGAGEFGRFFERVLLGDAAALNAEYESRLRAHPHG